MWSKRWPKSAQNLKRNNSVGSSNEQRNPNLSHYEQDKSMIGILIMLTIAYKLMETVKRWRAFESVWADGKHVVKIIAISHFIARTIYVLILAPLHIVKSYVNHGMV